MYPFIMIWGTPIYIFGLTLTICFFVFQWMLKRLCWRFGINSTFFFNRTIWYFVSVLFFSRFFYVIANWNEFKFINHPIRFFFMDDYNFSLMWGIFGFLLVLFISIIIKWLRSAKYIDAFTLSFLFTLPLGYVWAFLGGQVYWKPVGLGKWILYDTAISNIPYKEVFPLPLIYAWVFFFLFLAMYMIAMFVSIRWLIWYLWIIFFSSVILYLEQFNWQTDTFFNIFGINFTQICAIVLIIFSFTSIFRLSKYPNKQTEII